MQTRLTPTAYKVFKSLEGLVHFEGSRFLLSISGGTDSMALFALFREFERRFSIEISVTAVHHGLDIAEEQLRFRNESIEYVQATCKKLGWPFYTNVPAHSTLKKSSNEADYRDFRRGYLLELVGAKSSQERESCKFDFIVLGHHADDLLETRLIRLIRGTGKTGLRSMSKVDGFWLRPFLEMTKAELRAYAQESNCLGLEDPENANSRFLRNWIRESWLPDLEQYRPGATKTLARSLDMIVGDISEEPPVASSFGLFLTQDEGRWVLDRTKLNSMDREHLKQVLADQWLESMKNGMSSNQWSEVIKRLDTEQKVLEFDVGRCRWRLNAEHVEVILLTGSMSES